LIIGAVGLRGDDNGHIIGHCQLSLDPIFIEPEKSASDRLMTSFLRNKYQLTLALLKRELPGLRFRLQPG
jgi:hypothetical protein